MGHWVIFSGQPSATLDNLGTLQSCPRLLRATWKKSGLGLGGSLPILSKNYDFLLKTQDIQEEMRFWGLGGLGGGGRHFHCKYYKKNNQKTPSTYSASFGISNNNFVIARLENPKPIIFMVLGPGGRDHHSQNQLFLIWETPRYFQKTNQEIPNHF